MKKTLIALLAVLCFSSAAYAGGGPPQTFADLKYVAETYNQESIDYFNLTGQLPDWYGTDCVGWTNFTDNISYYFQYEGQFLAKATQNATTNTWKIKLALAGDPKYPIAMIPTYKLRRIAAQKQIAMMNVWHSNFQAFYDAIARGNRTFYCSVEEVCAPYMEPQFSTVMVWKKETSNLLVEGSQVHLFTFYLMVDAEDTAYAEDGVLTEVTLSMMMTGDHFEKVRNCSLISGGHTLAYQGQPYVNTEGWNAQLVFHDLTDIFLPKGTTTAFDVRCDVDPLEQYSYIQIGFIPNLGTGPNEAIEVIGENTAQKLIVSPDMDISHVLTN